MIKRRLFFIASGLSLLAAAFLANQSLFIVWQSAFPENNLELLETWFYIFCALTLISLLLAIILFIKAIRMKDTTKLH